jgi:hypothetical protein
LRNQNNEKINLEKFKEEYKIANVWGRIIPNKDLMHLLSYDEKTGYFILTITTISPRFSFALYHKDSCMAIYLPFISARRIDKYYAIDIKYRNGTYLLDLSIKNKERLYLGSNLPYNIIDDINWKKQSKKFVRSNYKNDNTYIPKQE